MKNLIVTLYTVLVVCTTIGLFVTGVVTMVKGDPLHVTVAYLAGGYVLADYTKEYIL